MTRVIGIVGVWDFPKGYSKIWQNFREALGEDDTLTVEIAFYAPWNLSAMRDFAKRILNKYDDGDEDIVLLGYSMGGVIATVIADQFTHTHVSKVVTVFSPHTFLWGVFTRKLGAPLETDARIVSFGAQFDYMVWWGSEHPCAEEHHLLRCDHLLGLIINPEHAKKIMAIALAP